MTMAMVARDVEGNACADVLMLATATATATATAAAAATATATAIVIAMSRLMLAKMLPTAMHAVRWRWRG
jgi:hypothetical protein